MKKILNVLRYETVLEMLEDGPVPDEELIENLEEKFPKKHILEVISRMEDKGYVQKNGHLIVKTKELFYNEL